MFLMHLYWGKVYFMDENDLGSVPNLYCTHSKETRKSMISIKIKIRFIVEEVHQEFFISADRGLFNDYQLNNVWGHAN